MAPSICDSEDEEEILVKDEEPSQHSRSSNFSYNQAVDFAKQVLSGSQLEGHDGSSLSTGEINRQIADTTRGFFSSTTDNSGMMVAPKSSAKQKLNRRHTAVNGSARAATPAKVSKRTQSTYGKAKSKAPRLSDTEAAAAAFQAYNNDERASQESLAFLQNSDTPKATDGLPTSTIQRGFQDHNPFTLFGPDTGTTIENNKSSEQRMVEAARQSPVKSANAANKSSNDSLGHQSSFPWSASSEHTQTPKVDKPKSPLLEKAAVDEANGDASVALDDLEHEHTAIVTAATPATVIPAVAGIQEHNQEAMDVASRHFQSALIATPQPDGKQHLDQDDEVVEIEQQYQLNTSKIPPKSSPMVIIPLLETPRTEQPASVQKSSRGRKRKSTDTEAKVSQHQRSDPLNSDDRAVGLPKERYVPRPSRRRATAVEDSIDFSVVPEKSLKKRRLTDGNPGDSLVDGSQPTKKVVKPTSKVVRSKQVKSPTPLPSTRRHPGDDEDADLKAAIAASLRDMQQSTAGKSSVIEDEVTPAATPKSMKPADWKEPDRPSDKDVSPLSSHDRPKRKANPVSHDVPQIKVQDKQKRLPAAQKLSPTRMLPPLPASVTRRTPRRSQTTIFEDHASQRSPTLSRLQAGRMAAIKNVTKPTQPSKRKRRTIVQNDVDEEDELGKDSPVQNPAPKKRGRPPKAEVVAKSKASRKVLEDSDEEKDHSEDDIPTRRRRKPNADAAAQRADSETNGREDAEVSSSKKGKKSRPASDVLGDSEDEPALLDEEAVTVKSVQKKAPGRPPKSRAKVLSDSEAEPELDDNDEDSDAQPKKKAPGRPAKGKTQATNATQDPTFKPALQPKDINADTAAKKSAPPSKEVTPVPSTEKPAPQPTARHITPAPKAKPNPNSHSPIKKTGMHRVGLAKGQRVQSLLKVIRPEARARKEDAARVTKVVSVAELEAKWNEVPE